MARKDRVSGEKPLFWMASSKTDLLDFPDPVKDVIGLALSVAQFGGKHPQAKPWKGEGSGVLEVVADYRTDTFRAVYTVRFEQAVLCTSRISKEIEAWIQDGKDRCRFDWKTT